MPDNDFWIGQEQIPVDLSLLLTYSNDEDYWYAPGEYALRVYTVDTLNTNFARPCFAFGERTSDPEMEDVSGAIENTLHELLDSGATPEDVYRIMGLVKESELSPETKEADSYLPIDLGYCIDGNIVSYEAVPEGVATVPENVDYPRYAEAMESHVPLPIATQIANHDFSHGQADILMEAARNPRVSHETLETIADKTLSSGKMRGLLDIASVGKNPLDFRNMDEQTLKAAVSVLFHGGKDLPVTELDLAQLRSVDLALMDGASPAEAMRAAEKSTSAEPEEPDASLASEAHDAKAARTALDEQPEEYVRRVLQDGGFRSDWGNPDYDPIGDFKETAGDEYRIPLLKVLLREQLESRYEVANHFSTMNRARVELSAFIQNEGGAPLPADALGTPEEQGIRAMLIATGEAPREVTLLPDKNGSTLKSLQALVGGNIETFDIAFGEEVSLYVNEEGLFTCPPNRAIFATEEMAKAGYLSQLDYSKVVEMGDFYTVLNGDIVAVGFDPETGESRSLTDGETARVEGYFTVISRPGSGAKAVDDIRHGITPGSYDISVESHDCTSGRNALAADAPARDAPGKDDQNIG